MLDAKPAGFGNGFAAGLGSVVADGTDRKVLPPITVIEPCRPGGAWFSGIFVGPGITRTGEPPTFETGNMVCAPAGMFAATGFGMNVACGTTIIGVPPITTVLPPIPGGALATGMLVGPGIIRKLEPAMLTVEG